MGTGELAGSPVAIYSNRLEDFSGEVIGVLSLAMDAADISIAIRELFICWWRSSWGDQALLDSDQFARALQGEGQMGTGELAGSPVAIYSNRLEDFSGEAIGVLSLAMDRSGYIDSYQGAVYLLVAIIGGFLMLGAVIGLYISAVWPDRWCKWVRS